jgi:hypothetical protein
MCELTAIADALGAETQIVGLFAGALVLRTLFVVRERSAADPLVPLAMPLGRVVATASIALLLATRVAVCRDRVRAALPPGDDRGEPGGRGSCSRR